MKKLFWLPLFLLAAGPCRLPAQTSTPITRSPFAENPVGITSTSRLFDDGSRVDTQKNRDEGTAKETYYNAAGKVTKRVNYLLDEQGRIREGQVCTPDGKVVASLSCTYDTFGRLSEQMDKTAQGAVLRRLVYQYDAQGNVASISIYDGQGKLLEKSLPTRNLPQPAPAAAPSSAKKKTR